MSERSFLLTIGVLPSTILHILGTHRGRDSTEALRSATGQKDLRFRTRKKATEVATFSSRRIKPKMLNTVSKKEGWEGGSEFPELLQEAGWGGGGNGEVIKCWTDGEGY
jgi:hypothetical protein